MKFALQRGIQIRQNKVEASSCKEEAVCTQVSGQKEGRRREIERRRQEQTGKMCTLR